MRNTITTVELSGQTYAIKQPESWALWQAARVLERVSSKPTRLDFRAMPEWSRWIITAALDERDPPWIDLPAADGIRLLTEILTAWQADDQFDEVPKARMYGQLVRQVGLLAFFFLAELPDTPRDPEAARRVFEAELRGETGIVGVLPAPAEPQPVKNEFRYDEESFLWAEWRGVRYDFSDERAKYFGALCLSRRAGDPYLTFQAIRKRSGCHDDYRSLFKDHPAKGTLIVKFCGEQSDRVGLHESIKF